MNKTEKTRTEILTVLKWIGIMIITLLAFRYLLESGIISQVLRKNYTDGDSTYDNEVAEDLSNEELAQLAANTYQWDCDEVISRGKMSNAGFYPIMCSNGKMLRVYPRGYDIPRITNKSGGSQ